MKSQSLPMSTIVMIIIAIVALAIIALFVIRGFLEGEGHTDIFMGITENKTDEAIEGAADFMGTNLIVSQNYVWTNTNGEL